MDQIAQKIFSIVRTILDYEHSEKLVVLTSKQLDEYSEEDIVRVLEVIETYIINTQADLHELTEGCNGRGN